MQRITDSSRQPFEAEHEKCLRAIAPECTLFLKRDGSFPLQGPADIALYGNGARRTLKGGTGSGDVNARSFVTVEQGLLSAGCRVTTADWLDGYERVLAEEKEKFIGRIREEAAMAGVPASMYGMGKIMPEPEYELLLNGKGETAVYVLARVSGEGSDRTDTKGDIRLTDSEVRDILLLNETYPRFMLVLNTGGMVDLSPVEAVRNILALGQLGCVTGDVLADILLGRSYPSGKLTMTWAPLSAYPSAEGFGDINDTLYREGVYVGYRYFNTAGETVAYPFGYGLGYTDFEVTPRRFYIRDRQAFAEVHVENTGKCEGREVVQLYAFMPDGQRKRPAQELMAFEKTPPLSPGDSADVTLCFEISRLCLYDEARSAYILPAGDYVIGAGTHSRNAQAVGVVRMNTDVTVRKCRNICLRPGSVEDSSCRVRRGRNADGVLDEIIVKRAAKIPCTENVLVADAAGEVSGVEEVCYGASVAGMEISDFIRELSDEELMDLCIGDYPDDPSQASVIGAASVHLAGGAGETSNRFANRGLGSLVMADGPAGLRLSVSYRIIDGRVKAGGSALGEDMMQFLTDEEKAMVLASSAPTREEQEAPEYYQYCTAIPIGTDIAQSFNPEVARSCGDIVGAEMEVYGIDLWLAPAMNIQRNPLCGRNFEYYSEDPYVSGVMAAAVTKGVQAHPGRGVTIKHYAANNQETNRYASNSVVGERALREIYLRGFEICIRESAPAAVMTSYNLVNGEHSATSKDLLTAVLRDEFGFEGIVMTDWYVTTDMMKHPQSFYSSASAAGLVKAGNDLCMPGTAQDKEEMKAALADPAHPYHITRKDLERCAERVVRAVKKSRPR